MITAFQQGRNCLIISEIFQVMVHTALSNVGTHESGGEGKREDSTFQLKDFRVKPPLQSQIKTCTFSKQSQMALKKDETMAKPLCASGGQILLNLSMKLEKKTGKVSLQAACSSWDTLCEHRET